MGLQTELTEQIVYKVVARVGDSLMSAIAHEHLVVYIPSEITTPELGLLFVFENLEAAKVFVGKPLSFRSPSLEIWKGIATNPVKMDKVLSSMLLWSNQSSLKYFWDKLKEDPNFKSNMSPAPKHTLCCESLTLTERVA
ncbi:MAG: hypothetical protein COV29_01625 [Candidatus Yanofskybacteria bacterium CG10_big_fil_rev_8_21_14_0_10_36_16]|uniref:Uncharacterized protein n=1 Tax=Candidatus Yanofskybacteria bacterium CG10_big_fil_rev_8_21_14_0_10_36_16 TaxID=1975096 RepID=A0A2J0QAY1_9BACT|nr:MAG: hypothetical protein COV29_01625 [Candidatus Yanofskybacteria bacterium CG10_big_fil_rev_8_21_14_0_10_36_16]